MPEEEATMTAPTESQERPEWISNMETEIQGTTESPPPAEETSAEAPSPEPASTDAPQETPPVVDADASDGDIDDILTTTPDDAPSPDNWKTFREGHKELKGKNKDLKTENSTLQQEISDLRAGLTPKGDVDLSMFGLPPAGDNGQAPVQPEVVTPKEAGLAAQDQSQTASPDVVFQTLAKIESGESDGQYRPACEQAIAQMSPNDVLGVIQSARSQAYGDASEDVMKLARERLPEVNATYDSRRDQNQKVQEWQSTRRDSMAIVASAEGMRDENSVQHKAWRNGAQELGNVLPGLQFQANAPELITEYVRLRGAADLVDSLQKEIHGLKKQLGNSTSPQPSGENASTETTSTWMSKMQAEVDNL